MGNTLSSKSIRAQAKRDGVTHFSTGIAVVRDQQLLLVRRAAHDTFGGCFELPGGGVDEGESITEGAIRELKEETGLTISETVTIFEGYDYTASDKPHVRLINFLVKVLPGEISLDPNEHDAYKWIKDVSELDKLKTFPNMKRCITAALSLIDQQ